MTDGGYQVAPFVLGVATASQLKLTWQNAVLASAAAGSLITVLLLPSQLFDQVVKDNYDEMGGILGLLRRRRRERAQRRTTRKTTMPVLALYVALASFISLFVDPSVAFDRRTVVQYLASCLAYAIPLCVCAWCEIHLAERRLGERGHIDLRAGILLFAIGTVAVSRLCHVYPGYLYGVVADVVFLRKLSAHERGQNLVVKNVSRLGVALAAWVLLGLIRGPAADPHTSLALVFLSDALGVITVATLTTLVLVLLPIKFFEGHFIYLHNKVGWTALFGASVVAFIEIVGAPSFAVASTRGHWSTFFDFFAACILLTLGLWFGMYLRSRQTKEFTGAQGDGANGVQLEEGEDRPSAGRFDPDQAAVDQVSTSAP